MGLFDFVKSAGEKVFDMVGLGDNEAENQKTADSLKGLVRKMDLEVQDLAVAFDDGTATVNGQVPAQSVKEKVVLVVGNTAGVSQVDDRMRVVPPTPEAPPEPEAVFYTVTSGDTLGKIAKVHYGNAMKYPVIFEANRPMLKDPDRIYPGQMLRIPPL